MASQCQQCQFFYITYNAKTPRGCRAFQFETNGNPSDAVYEQSGVSCLKFQPKPNQQNKESN